MAPWPPSGYAHGVEENQMTKRRALVHCERFITSPPCLLRYALV